MLRSAAPGLGPCWKRCVVLCLLIGLSPATASGQARDRDARLPRHGRLWIEFAPTFANWSDQYALGSAVAADGEREPLAADYGGPITSRIFPGLDPLLSILNTDAEALGFDSLTAAEVSMGSLGFGTINVNVRQLPFHFQFGLFDRLALEVGVPIVRAEVEPSFSFDSTSANLVRADAALAALGSFLTDLETARSALQALVDGGTLTPEDEATALALLQDSGEFSTALGAREEAESYLFTAGSAAGQQMTTLYGGFAAGFGSFGVGLPAFTLPSEVTAEDLDAFFTRPPLSGEPLGNLLSGWKIGEIEVGVRLGLIDTFGHPRAKRKDGAPQEEVPPEQPEEVPPEQPGEAPLERPGEARPVQTGEAPPELAEPGGIRFRTTVGVKYRFPISDADSEPFLAPELFLQQPIGDGQPDLELELYQDIQFGRKVLLVTGVRYGIQQADELTRRVSAPGKPFALAEQQALVQRNLGDFFELRVSPRLRFNDALSLAVEYTYWNKQADGYALSGAGRADAGPLALETREKRHRLGIGVYYRTTARYTAGLSDVPVELAIIYQPSVGGSGGRTPVSEVFTASLRVPLSPF